MCVREGTGMKPDVQASAAFQPPLLSQPHRNQHLFSDYYLNSILPAREDWQMLGSVAEPVMRELAGIFHAFTPTENEAQTEEGLVRPVLKALGHTYEVQAALETPAGAKRPDYIFYQTQAALLANKGKKLSDVLLQGRAVAVGDAKYWNRPLDISLKTATGDPFNNKNPSYQMAFYMQHSGLEWGILTNGRLWRLYHQDTAHKLDRFYEVDLAALLAAGNVQDFLYFYAFFRRDAFDSGDLGVAAFLKASVEYARGVGNSLKEQVYLALRHVAQGLLDYPPNKLQPDLPTLTTIYHNALIVLYRLLFILYAEARELLPLRASPAYRDSYSLERLKKIIQHDLDAHKTLLPTTATIWPQLQALIGIINEGSPPLRVATFNGGLFDPAQHPFLAQHGIGDQHLQQAIDRLARVDGQFVDYRDLAERHLGTIYEGLLEFHLEPLEQPEDGWTIALVNEKGERKATGSYYTPDYIVKYMVEETLRPLLEGAVAEATSDQEKVERILSLRICDPAMGSGHFPVEATEYIARFLVETLEQPQTDTKGEADLTYWKRRVAQSCIYGVDLNPLAVDLAKLSLWLATVAKDRPLSFLDHHLRCGNSLIGTRGEELLLLGSTSQHKPAGKKTQKPADTPVAQPTLFDEAIMRQMLTTAVDLMQTIEANPAQTVGEVKEQEQIYRLLRQRLTDKYLKMADILASVPLGMKVDAALWQPLVDTAAGKTFITPHQIGTLLQHSVALAAQHRFFHWELEFPEVFFDHAGHPKGPDAGFTAMLGNPPYLRQEQFSLLKSYLNATYQTYHGMADLYVYFYEQGLRLLRAGGRMAYIVTNKWMRAGYGEPLRAFFAKAGALERVIDFGHAPIFEDADVFPCILVLEKPAASPEDIDSPERQVQVVQFPREELGRVSLERYIREHSHPLPHSRFGRTAWTLETSTVDDLLAKIRRVGVKLSEFASVKPFYGIKTGLNEAFLIDTPTRARLIKADPRSDEIIKPFLRGQDIKRWFPEWAGLWMIVLKSSGDYAWPWSRAADEASAEQVFQQTYPSLHGHMKALEEKLRKRSDRGRYWWELRSCAYYKVFEQAKIIYQVIQFHPAYSLDAEGHLSNDKTFFLPKADSYILAVLNSPLMWWHNWRYLPHMKDEALNPAVWLLETLPIAPPSEAIQAEVEPVVARLIKIAQANLETRQVTLDWLRTRFGLESPGVVLENLARLDQQTFLAEVGKRLPKTALTPATIKDLTQGYHSQTTPWRERLAEAAELEQRLDALVNSAYGLTPEEMAVLKETAPPRMPNF
jgi:hypothetical protein